jgi:hypothetical protein
LQGRRQEGVYWYKKAAELGDSAGQCNLGLAYLQGTFMILLDAFTSVKTSMWLVMLLVKHHFSLEFMGLGHQFIWQLYWMEYNSLGTYIGGIGNLSAVFYVNVTTEPANPTEAVMWFRRAAFSGHVRAQYSLALCLQQGRGVECSSSKAVKMISFFCAVFALYINLGHRINLILLQIMEEN